MLHRACRAQRRRGAGGPTAGPGYAPAIAAPLPKVLGPNGRAVLRRRPDHRKSHAPGTERDPTLKRQCSRTEEMLMSLFNARRSRRAVLGSAIAGLLAVGGGVLEAANAKEPSGQVVMAWHVTIAPSWFDPSTAPPQITPFGMLYAIHDAL